MEENNAPFPAYGDEVIQAEGLRKIFALSRRQRAKVRGPPRYSTLP